MSWEVRAYAPDESYACVTINSGQITVQGDPNPVSEEQPAVQADSTPELSYCELHPEDTENC